jgi:hypothetical protein
MTVVIIVDSIQIMSMEQLMQYKQFYMILRPSLLSSFHRLSQKRRIG